MTIAPGSGSLAQLRERLNWPDSRPLSLVSFAIAGVQEFLAAARTTRDIWNGSYLISFLTFRGTKALLEAIGDRTGRNPCDVLGWVLMPNVASQPLVHDWLKTEKPADLRVANFPNSVLVAAPGSKKEAAKLAGVAEAAVQKAWNDILKCCAEELDKRQLLSPEFTSPQLNYQTSFGRVFELYWSVLEVPPDDGLEQRLEPILGGAAPTNNHYAMLIEASGRVLGSRKMLRDFAQIGQEGDRCSLCGARTALANYDVASRPERRWRGRVVRVRHGRLTDYWEGVHEKFPHRFHRSERLCAVCLVRRLAPLYYFPREVFGGEEVRFPSTSTLCTANAVAELIEKAQQDPRFQKPMADFVNKLNKARETCPEIAIESPPLPCFENLPRDSICRYFAQIDGDWFYEDQYDAKSRAYEYENRVSEEQFKQCFPDNFARTLRSELADLGYNFQPSNYFALIRADGDHMGEWVGGRMNSDDFGPEWLATLSAALANFAEKIRPRLEFEIPGKLVYAGGDDLLAFVPREKVLDAIQAIEETFSATASCAAPGLSISIGCILARHNDPMSSSMDISEELLKDKAKEEFGRQAFAIRRTTGGDLVAGMPLRWGTDQPLKKLRTLYGAMIDRVKTDRHGLSARIVEHLAQLQEGLAGASHEARQEMLAYAIGRHFTPDRDPSASEPAKQTKDVKDAASDLYRLLADWHNELKKPNTDPPPDPFDALLNLLAMLRFLTREGR